MTTPRRSFGAARNTDRGDDPYYRRHERNDDRYHQNRNRGPRHGDEFGPYKNYDEFEDRRISRNRFDTGRREDYYENDMDENYGKQNYRKIGLQEDEDYDEGNGRNRSRYSRRGFGELIGRYESEPQRMGGRIAGRNRAERGDYSDDDYDREYDDGSSGRSRDRNSPREEYNRMGSTSSDRKTIENSSNRRAGNGRNSPSGKLTTGAESSKGRRVQSKKATVKSKSVNLRGRSRKGR